MSANVRYLSQRSLAVYEATLIEQFTAMHKRNVQIQTFTFAAYATGFVFLASMTIFLPVATQGFIQLLFHH
ncbi:MAG: hypothetical protein H7249_08030 [Chitinophagaceae bacterium]|nr:hypothetical protein [Oligoflexus sp.]